MNIATILNIIITIFLSHSLIAADAGAVTLPSLAKVPESIGEVRVRDRVILPSLGVLMPESEDTITERRAPRAGERDKAVKFVSTGDELSGAERKDLADLLAKTAERYYQDGKRTRAYALYVQAGDETAKGITRMGGMCLYASRAAQYYCAAARIAFYIEGVEDKIIIDLFSKGTYYAEIASLDDPNRITVKYIGYPIRKTMIQARDSGLRHLADALGKLL